MVVFDIFTYLVLCGLAGLQIERIRTGSESVSSFWIGALLGPLGLIALSMGGTRLMPEQPVGANPDDEAEAPDSIPVETRSDWVPPWLEQQDRERRYRESREQGD